MDIIAACTGKSDPKSLAFMQTSMYWMLGREWLRWMGKSSDSWTASCIDLMNSINAGVYVPTPEQQNNLSTAIGSDGASYLWTVESALNASSQYPPGTEGPETGSLMSCHLIPTVFGFFAHVLAGMYKDSVANNNSTFSDYLKAGIWGKNVSTQSQDAAYQPVQPYGNPAGIDPGPVATQPPPPPPGGKDITPQPPSIATWTNYTPWIIGGIAAVGLGVAGYMVFGNKSHSVPARSNPGEGAGMFKAVTFTSSGREKVEYFPTLTKARDHVGTAAHRGQAVEIWDPKGKLVHIWYPGISQTATNPVLSSRKREELSDSAFALPRLRKLPIHDYSHAKGAYPRLNMMYNQGSLSDQDYVEAYHRIARAAKKFGIELRTPPLVGEAYGLNPSRW